MGDTGDALDVEPLDPDAVERGAVEARPNPSRLLEPHGEPLRQGRERRVDRRHPDVGRDEFQVER